VPSWRLDIRILNAELETALEPTGAWQSPAREMAVDQIEPSGERGAIGYSVAFKAVISES
jgi:hypothetical protein